MMLILDAAYFPHFIQDTQEILIPADYPAKVEVK